LFEKVRFAIRGQDPEVVRDRLRAWHEDREWVRWASSPVLFTSSPTVSARTELKSAFTVTGLVINLALGIATFGVWLVVVAVYYAYVAVVESPFITLEAYPDGVGNTRVKLKCVGVKRKSADAYLAEINEWLESEFGAEKLAGSDN
jgi:hypothetical protein